MRALLRTSAGVLAAWILASPVNFWWGLRGLVVQAHSLAHGGEQNASLWTLFGMAVGAMQQPLVRDAGHFTGAWHEFASIAACLLAAAGVVHAVLSRQRALPVAVAVASAILFAFVAHRYTMPPSTAMPEPRTILTWNLFKAASFLAPFVFTVAIMGTLSLALQRGGQRLLKAAAGVLTGMLLMVALHQATWGAGQMTLVRLSPELPALAARVPPGRLLVDVHNGDGAIDYYQRYAAYSLLGGHRFLSARDWYPGELEDLLKPVRKTLAEPFATVLTDRPGDYPQLPTIAHAGAYSILDARGQDLRTELQSFDGVRLPLVSLGASAAPRTVDAQVYNLRPGRMLVAGPREIRVLPVADAPMQQATLQVPPEGMLAQLVFDPAPRGRAEVFLRDAGVTAPPAQPVDLLPLLTDASISTDPNGARMALQPAERGVRLAQDRAGTSRARAALELEPGEYLLHIELGAVAVRDKAAGGFGAFFGPENDHAASIELEPLAHGHHYLRVSVAKKQTLFYVIGFGGWGSASGSMELRALELVRRPGLAGRA